MRSRLWAPAAAISSARRARSCPRRSARSGAGGVLDRTLVDRIEGRRVDLASEVAHDLVQMANGNGLDAGERRLRCRLRRADEPRQSGAESALGHGQRAGDGPHAAVQRELADGRVLGEPLGRELPRGAEDRE